LASFEQPFIIAVNKVKINVTEKDFGVKLFFNMPEFSSGSL